MGATNGTQVNIHLDRENPFFYAGERISGTVDMYIKEGQVEADEIYIQLQGEAAFRTIRTVYDYQGRLRTETDYRNTVFLKEKSVIERPVPGQNELIYPAGQYSWRFDIAIPNPLPPTLNGRMKYPHVRYHLGFVIDKPWYKPNKHETVPLMIYPYINLSNNPQYMSPSLFANNNWKDVTLRVSLDRLGYVPGEMITGTVEIENPQRLLLKEIHATLAQHNKVHDQRIKEKVFDTHLSTIVFTKEEHTIERIALPIPYKYLAPSFVFHGGYGYSYGVDVEVFYMLEFTVKAEGIFTNFEINMPITIGTAL